MSCFYCGSLDWSWDGYDWYCTKCGTDRTTSTWRKEQEDKKRRGAR